MFLAAEAFNKELRVDVLVGTVVSKLMDERTEAGLVAHAIT